MTRRLLFFGVLFMAILLKAETRGLLQHAVTHWTGGKEELAFTQRSRTLNDDGSVKEERVERYDPSLPDDRRWHLLEVDGKPPTAEQRESIEFRRNRKPRKHANKPVGDVLDFPNATMVHETENDITYEVGLRPDAARFVQTDKLLLRITVGRQNHSIERVTAGLREPMRVALGLAKITDVDFDLTFDGADGNGAPAKEEDDPNGTAKISLSKLGTRMEYEWCEFKRVDAYHSPAPR